MNLMEFNHRFPDEHSAMMAIKELREKQGVTCRKCSLDAHYGQKTVESFQCKKAELVKDCQAEYSWSNPGFPIACG